MPRHPALCSDHIIAQRVSGIRQESVRTAPVRQPDRICKRSRSEDEMFLVPAVAAALLAGPPFDVKALDAALAKAYQADAPGASVVVVRDGVVAFHKSYGLANVGT